MATWTMYSNTPNHSAPVGQPQGHSRGYMNRNPLTPTSPTSQPPNVGFKVKTVHEPEEEERKKYLTAKYGQHQMRLIKKRLQVEDWVDEELQMIYNVSEDTGSYDCELDLDELLDLDTDVERRQFLQEKLANARQSPVVINKFITELLQKASTL